MNSISLAKIIVTMSLAALIGGCCTPPALSSVGVQLVPQERDWWCWAATTEMISGYYGNQIEQCESANYVHGSTPDCCTGCVGNCDCWGSGWGASITNIKNNWTHWGFSYKHASSELSWDDLKSTISTTPYCKRSPIQAVWWWTGGGGHVVTVYGYAEIGGTNYVAYYNPLPVSCQRDASGTCSTRPGGEDVVSTYAAFENSAAHDWGDSFYNFSN